MQKKLAYSVGWIAAVFFCIVCFSVRVQAAPAVSAQASASSAKQGDKVSVTVTVQGNDGLSSALFMLNYDNKVLKYISSSWGAGIQGGDATSANDLGSAIQLSLNSSSGYYGNGTLVTLNFEALQNADTLTFNLQVGDLVGVQTAADTSEEDGWEESSDEDSWEEDSSDDAWETDEEEEVTASGGWINDTAWNSQDKKSSKKSSQSTSQEVTNDTQNTSDAAEGTETATVEAAKVSTVSSGTRTSSSSQTDRTYKTGVGLGNDIFIILFAVAAVAGLLGLVRRNKSE